MPDPTVHPSLTANNTFESLVNETLNDEPSPRDTFVSEAESTAFDSCNVMQNCERIFLLQRDWSAGKFDSWDTFNAARARALRTLLHDLYYSAAADQIP